MGGARRSFLHGEVYAERVYGWMIIPGFIAEHAFCDEPFFGLLKVCSGLGLRV